MNGMFERERERADDRKDEIQSYIEWCASAMVRLMKKDFTAFSVKENTFQL